MSRCQPGRGRGRSGGAGLEAILIHKAVVNSDEFLSLEPEIAQQLLEQVISPRGAETRTGRRVTHGQFDNRLRLQAVKFMGISLANYRIVLVFLLPKPPVLEYPSQE